MEELMEIGKVQDQLKRILAELEIKAHEAGSFAEEERYTYDAEVIVNALEYLWMYEDLME